MLAAGSLRADRVIGRIRALSGDTSGNMNGNTLVFPHRDILRVFAARWLGLHAVKARRLYLDTASVSILVITTICKSRSFDCGTTHGTDRANSSELT